MAQGELDLILERIDALSPDEMRRLRRELDAKVAASEGRPPVPPTDQAERRAAAGRTPAPAPAWKRVLENMSDVPDEVFDRIPADSSAQLDHYLYDTPKRPTS